MFTNTPPSFRYSSSSLRWGSDLTPENESGCPTSTASDSSAAFIISFNALITPLGLEPSTALIKSKWSMEMSSELLMSFSASAYSLVVQDFSASEICTSNESFTMPESLVFALSAHVTPSDKKPVSLLVAIFVFSGLTLSNLESQCLNLFKLWSGSRSPYILPVSK